MEHIVCSIRDAAVEAFGPPFFVPRIGAAMRAFSDAVNNNQGDTPLNKHADDHDLYQLGVFDDNTGQISCLPQPRILAKGKEVKTT